MADNYEIGMPTDTTIHTSDGKMIDAIRFPITTKPSGIETHVIVPTAQLTPETVHGAAHAHAAVLEQIKGL